MERPPKKTVYVVRELFTREYGDQPPAVKSPAVWAFPDLEQATACRQQLEWEAREFVNPCYCIETVEVDAEPLKQSVYVVQRLCWQYNDNWNDLANDEPVKAFRDRERAEIYRLEFEEPAREQVRNPCRYAGALKQASSLDSEQLIARLQQLGALLPGAGPTALENDFDFWDEDWWDRLWDELPRRQWHDVYDLFDKVRFYEVVEVETDG